MHPIVRLRARFGQHGARCTSVVKHGHAVGSGCCVSAGCCVDAGCCVGSRHAVGTGYAVDSGCCVSAGCCVDAGCCVGSRHAVGARCVVGTGYAVGSRCGVGAGHAVDAGCAVGAGRAVEAGCCVIPVKLTKRVSRCLRRQPINVLGVTIVNALRQSNQRLSRRRVKRVERDVRRGLVRDLLPSNRSQFSAFQVTPAIFSVVVNGDRL